MTETMTKTMPVTVMGKDTLRMAKFKMKMSRSTMTVMATALMKMRRKTATILIYGK